MTRTQRFLVFFSAIALAACEDARPEPEDEALSEIIACCAPPSEDEMDDLLQSAEDGDINAIRRAAAFYILQDGEDAELEALRWLEMAASKGSPADADKLVMFHLSHGECEAARESYSRLRASIDGYPTPGGARDVSVAECFERPIGEGDWSTRRKAEP